MDDNSQTEEFAPNADWAQLPPGAIETSLWESLHDAVLKHAILDSAAKALLLEFDIWHIRRFHQLPDDTRFLLRFSRVTTIDIRDDASVSWSDFCEQLSAEKRGADVFEASFAEVARSAVALRLFLHVNDEFYPDLIVRAEDLAISVSTGQSLTVPEFLLLGEAYWQDFADKGRERRAAAEPTNAPGT